MLLRPHQSFPNERHFATSKSARSFQSQMLLLPPAAAALGTLNVTLPA